MTEPEAEPRAVGAAVLTPSEIRWRLGANLQILHRLRKSRDFNPSFENSKPLGKGRVPCTLCTRTDPAMRTLRTAGQFDATGTLQAPSFSLPKEAAHSQSACQKEPGFVKRVHVCGAVQALSTAKHVTDSGS